MAARCTNPDFGRRSHGDFVSVHVQGKLNLLEEAASRASTVDRFASTSIMSLMISAAQPRRRRQGGMDHRRWGAADATEHLRRHQAFRRASAPPVSRDPWPADARLGYITALSRGGRQGRRGRPVGAQQQSQRALVPAAAAEDAAAGHAMALDKGPEIGLDAFIVSEDAVQVGRLRGIARRWPEVRSSGISRISNRVWDGRCSVRSIAHDPDEAAWVCVPHVQGNVGSS
jgi:hypothetical protein